MSKSQQAHPQNPSDDFTPKSFVVFCIDEQNNIAFETSWGENISDVKNFALLLSKIVTGELNGEIMNQLKEQSKELKDGSKKYSILNKAMKKSTSSGELVVDPMNVELS